MAPQKPSTSSSSPSGGRCRQKFVAGEVAGIGIACAVVGAAIAALILFILMSRRYRRKLSRQQHHVQPTTGGHLQSREKKPGMITTVANVDRLLPQPSEDDALTSGLSKIRDGIKNHVQNYYHNAPVDPQMANEAGLTEVARVLAMPASEISDLFLNPASRIPMIRLFIAHLIISRCSGQIDRTSSFLPGEVSVLAASDVGGKDSTAVQVALFSKWKSISGALLQQRYSKQPDAHDPREVSITNALAVADSVLAPFANPGIDTNLRRRNLEGIVRRAAQYAFQLFCQPASFAFDYSSTGQPETLVVFPALVMTVSHEAERLSPPRVLTEKEIVTGLGRY